MSPTDGIIQATGDLFAKVPGVASTGGVALNAPPAAILSDVHSMIAAAMKDIPADERGRLVTIATKAPSGNINVNLAVATKVGQHVNVVTWIGKTWGEPVSAGVMGEVHF